MYETSHAQRIKNMPNGFDLFFLKSCDHLAFDLRSRIVDLLMGFEQRTSVKRGQPIKAWRLFRQRSLLKENSDS